MPRMPWWPDLHQTRPEADLPEREARNRMMQTLHGQGFMLRPFRHADVPQFVAAVRESRASVGVWMPWAHEGYDALDAQAWFDICADNLAAGSSYDVGVYSPDGRELYGGVAVSDVHSAYNMGNLGYWIRASRQRQGLASRAAAMMACFAFHRLRLTRLEIVAAEHNAASRGVAEKIGAQFECIARNRLVMHGLPCAAAVYSLVPESFGPASLGGRG